MASRVPSLTHLILRECQLIGTSGVRALTQGLMGGGGGGGGLAPGLSLSPSHSHSHSLSQHHHNLVMLDLSSNFRLGDEGAAALAQVIGPLTSTPSPSTIK